MGHRVDLVDRHLQRSGDVRVGWLVKADVAVANLHKGEIAVATTSMRGLGECPGRWNAAAHSPDQACACPRHAFQKSPTINAVVVEVLQFLIDKVFALVL